MKKLIPYSKTPQVCGLEYKEQRAIEGRKLTEQQRANIDILVETRKKNDRIRRNKDARELGIRF